MPMRKRFLSILCILSLLLSMMIPGAFAAEGTQNESTVTLQFVYPEDVPQDEVNLSVFKGVPEELRSHRRGCSRGADHPHQPVLSSPGGADAS